MTEEKTKKIKEFLDSFSLRSPRSDLRLNELGKKFGIPGFNKIKSYTEIVQYRRQRHAGEQITFLRDTLPLQVMKNVKGARRAGLIEKLKQNLGLYSLDDAEWLKDAIIGNFPEVSDEEVDYHLKSMLAQASFSTVFDGAAMIFCLKRVEDVDLSDEGLRELQKNLQNNLQLINVVRRLNRLRRKTKRLEKKVLEEQKVDPVDVFESLFKKGNP
jgi:hypothetical protein